jgi:mono/diheme cytochrome c family protein
VEAAIVRIIITIMTRWRPSPPSGSLSPGNAFQKQGFVRIGSENVVGPMPPYGEIIGTEDDIWKIIAWIRSKHCEQDPARF